MAVGGQNYPVYSASSILLTVFCLVLTFLPACLAQPSRAGQAVVSEPLHPVVTEPDTILLDVSKSLADQLLPFDSLYEIAVRHSPLVRFEEAMVDGKVASLSLSKVAVLQVVSPFFTYATGNQAYLNTGTVASDFLQSINGRRMGINIQVPVSELLGRRHKINQMRAELSAASARKDISKLELKRDLNRTYQGLLTAHRLLGIRIRDAQLAMMAYRVAEVEMQQGKISAANLASSSNVNAIAQHNVEKERGDMLSFLYDMVALVGVDLAQLIAKH